MRIIDISNDLLTAEVFDGDPVPELAAVKSIADGDLYNINAIYAGLHNGTHADAPLHFIDGGKSIDEIPLEVFIGPCTVLQVSPGIITGEVVEKYFPRNVKRLLLKSNGRAFIHKSAADAMAYQGYFLIGTDGQTVEPPQSNWETHKSLLGNSITLLEGLNLSEAKNGEYFLIAPPVKISSAEAAPTRALLITDYIFWSGKPEC